MALTFKAVSSSKNFTEIPSGSHLGVCDVIADLGLQAGLGLFAPKRHLYIRFEVPAIRTTGRKVNGPAVVGRTFTGSMHLKSSLRGFIEAWLGASFSDDKEAERFDLETLLGKPGLLSTVSIRKDNNKVFTDIASISPIPAGTPAPIPEMEPLLYCTGHLASYRALPEWLRKKIDGQIIEPRAPRPDPAPDRELLEITDSDIPF